MRSNILGLPICLGFLALNVNDDLLDSRWLLNIFNLTSVIFIFLCADLDLRITSEVLSFIRLSRWTVPFCVLHEFVKKPRDT